MAVLLYADNLKTLIVALVVDRRQKLSTLSDGGWNYPPVGWNPTEMAPSAEGTGHNGDMASPQRRRSASPTRQTHLLTIDGQQVRVVRSARRTRTIQGSWVDGMVQVAVPMRMTQAQTQEAVSNMLATMERKRQQQVARLGTDGELLERARHLAAVWLNGEVDPVEVVWSSRQMKRWGSCTPLTGRIRISEMLRPMPDWVQDAVIIHELAHLKHHHHDAQFHAFARRYPRQDEAMGFLAGVSFAVQRALSEAPSTSADDVDDEEPQLS